MRLPNDKSTQQFKIYNFKIMTRLDYDIDNFSGTNGRGTRYDIVSDGEVIYHDVAEEEVDRLCEEMERKPYLYCDIKVVELN